MKVIKENQVNRKYCLWCSDDSHFTHECHSTHGITTPKDIEISRLVTIHNISKNNELIAILREALESHSTTDYEAKSYLDRIAILGQENTMLWDKLYEMKVIL